MSILGQLSRTMILGKSQEFVFHRPESGKDALASFDDVGLYIHVPFCESMCPYCPYNKVRYEPETAKEYARALLAEIEQYYLRFGKIKVTSIYIGGGTPTLLLNKLEKVFERIYSLFDVRGEICLETTPADLSSKNVQRLRSCGVELLSVGVQSFNENNLRFLGRKYDRESVVDALRRASEAGFSSVNLDLIFALPGQTQSGLREDLGDVVKCGADQITCYPLFTFPYTVVGRHLGIENVRMPGLVERRRLYRTIHEYCEENGYDRTSVWGFKRRGSLRYSSVTRHRFLGLGAGAGSHLPGLFYFNTFNVEEYTRTSLEGRLPIALEMKMGPSLEAAYWLYWRLYDTEINKCELLDRMGEEGRRRTIAAISMLKILGLCEQNKERLTLTERGAFWIHLAQNQYVLSYIDKVWTIAMANPWPRSIAI